MKKNLSENGENDGILKNKLVQKNMKLLQN